MKLAEWHAESERLRAAGLDALADFYGENAKRIGRGEPPVWPIPPDLRASTLLATKPAPPPSIDDGRED